MLSFNVISPKSKVEFSLICGDWLVLLQLEIAIPINNLINILLFIVFHLYSEK